MLSSRAEARAGSARQKAESDFRLFCWLLLLSTRGAIVRVSPFLISPERHRQSSLPLAASIAATSVAAQSSGPKARRRTRDWMARSCDVVRYRASSANPVPHSNALI